MKVLQASICRGIVAAAVLAGEAASATSVYAQDRTVVVRIYENVGLSADVQARALTEASAPFLAASVLVRWLSCAFNVRSLPVACAARLHASERVIRIVNGRVFPQGWRVPLGDASIERGSDEGMFATIYYDRVQWFAAKSHADLATVLGRVIAHELGHLLMASVSHTGDGLMRASWSATTRGSAWRFSPTEVEAMRRRLADSTPN